MFEKQCQQLIQKIVVVFKKRKKQLKNIREKISFEMKRA